MSEQTIKLCDAPKYMSVDRMRFHPDNPRTIDPDRLEDMKQSIINKGFYKPILIWKHRNTILEGNHRVKAINSLMSEGWVPVSPKGEKNVLPIVVLDVDDKTASKILIESNTSYARWIDDLLREQIAAAKAAGDDMKDYGLTDLQVETLLSDALASADDILNKTKSEAETKGLTDEDEIPEPPKVPKGKLGDLYILGNHRLLCGDSVKKDDVKKLMVGEKADMIFTDPPYNVAYGSSLNPKWGKKWNGKKDGVIKNDKQSPEDWIKFCGSIAGIIKEFLNGSFYVCHAPGPDGMTMTLTMVECGLHWSSTIIWNKDRMTLGRSDYQRKYEGIFYGWPEDVKINHLEDRTQTDVWDCKRPSVNDLHPTMKPVEIMERAIANSSKKGNLVLDLFLGSGSTMIACEKTGRKCYGIEIDPVYCDTIIERWQNFTGKKAHRLEKDGKKTLWSDIKKEKK